MGQRQLWRYHPVGYRRWRQEAVLYAEHKRPVSKLSALFAELWLNDLRSVEIRAVNVIREKVIPRSYGKNIPSHKHGLARFSEMVRARRRDRVRS